MGLSSFPRRVILDRYLIRPPVGGNGREAQKVYTIIVKILSTGLSVYVWEEENGFTGTVSRV